MNLLHVINGDASAERLRRSGAAGEILVYCELYHEGPVASGLEDDAWRQTRARHFSQRGWAEQEEFLQRSRRMDERLGSFQRFDEVVLWFEHDLYDQLLLIRHLDWFSRRRLEGTRLSLVCIDRFPGHEPFRGLGQLSPQEHASLLESRQPVSPQQLGLGRRAWQAFTSDAPARLEQLVLRGTPSLPFLAPALRRHLEEFPSLRDGLSRNQRQILTALRQGAATPALIFRACSEMEECPYLGDTTFFSYLDDLACAPHPPLTAEQGDFIRPTPILTDEFLRQPLLLTSAGDDLLNGKADAIELNGIDRWLGGVHLDGSPPLWRWHDQQGRLVRIQAQHS